MKQVNNIHWVCPVWYDSFTIRWIWSTNRTTWTVYLLAIVFESNHMGGLLARHCLRIEPYGRFTCSPLSTNRTTWTGSSLAMDCHGLPWTAMDCHGLPWTAIDCHWLPLTAIDCHWLPWTAIDCHCIRFVVIILLNTGIFLSPISCFLTHFWVALFSRIYWLLIPTDLLEY